MIRLANWQAAFAAELQRHRTMPFEWGKHDCATFACDCAAAVTAFDPMHDLRIYSDKEQADAIIDKEGGLIEMADARFGARQRPTMARVADVGLVHTEQGPALAVCNGTTWIAASADGGLVALPFEAALMCWRVGG
jgi:hypothetical protein